MATYKLECINAVFVDNGKQIIYRANLYHTFPDGVIAHVFDSFMHHKIENRENMTLDSTLAYEFCLFVKEYYKDYSAYRETDFLELSN